MMKKSCARFVGFFVFSLATQTMTLQAETFSVVGAFPTTESDAIRAPLVEGPNGALYGTASEGGIYGQGSVFRINTDGTGLTNLYTFFAGNGPYHPFGGLICSGDTLYGTLSDGGSSFAGALFKIKTDGSGFTNFFSFGFSNGANPYGRLLLSGNTLYGTTQSGGAHLFGGVFKINTDGTQFSALYGFSNGGIRNPQAGLVLSGNTLYGTAFYGGVFKIDNDGQNYGTVQTVAGNPFCDLVLDNNTLYGTTQTGGTNGLGSVFSVDLDGSNFTTLHSFNGTDGQTSQAGLVLVGNTLYGTTHYGGATDNGVVFKVNTDGSGFAVVYQFTGKDDGGAPEAGLINVGGVLYGTTEYHNVIYKLDLSATGPAPSLAFHSSPGNLDISWPSTATGFNLQESPDLSAGSWVPFNGTVNDDGTTKSVSVDPSTGNEFFELSPP